MGINLWDIGAFATGAIERDREHTAENLKIRGDELAAKRDSLIRRKNANYEIDLKAYAKEREKANAIKSLNAEGDIGSYNYATKWLNITDSGFKDYKESQQNNMITSFMTTLAKNKDADGNIIAKTYTATGASKEELEAKYADQEAKISKIITDETLKQRQKSFLINKILGIKDEDTDIDAQIAAALKAEKKVEDVTNTGLTQTLTEDKIPANIDTAKFKAYKDEVAALNKGNAWKNERDGVTRVSHAATAKAMGFDTKNYVNYKDGKPVGFNIAGDSYELAYEKIYNAKHAENDKQNFSLELYLANNDKGALASNPKLSNAAIHSDTQRLLYDRGTENKVRGVNSFSMVPLNMVNDNNKLVYDGKTYTLSNNQLLNDSILSAKTIYNTEVGAFVAKSDFGIEGWAGKDEVHRAYSRVQNGLTIGTATYAKLDNHIKEKIIKELKLVPDADKKVITTDADATVTEDKKVTEVEKTDKKVTGDKSHIIVQNGKVIDTKTGDGEPLDEINKNGKIDLLPEHIKNSKEFKKWASKNKINVFKAPILGEEPEFIYKTNRKGVRVKVKNPNYIDTSPKKVTRINKKRVR